jgi:hypothetical protein
MPDLKTDFMAWWERAIIWFRRWGWVPIAVVLLILGFILGGFLMRRRKGGRVSDPLSDIRNAVDENNLKIDAEIAEAQIERDRQLAKIEEKHRETLAALDEDQKKRAEQYRRNPRRLSRWLTGLAKGE